ncbi:hypothetical protein [Arthrobacter sp. CJ23]|uniref:hypothetical protein n=1 Tax=Arthrobacter sp. CJ23 TaxID=2972479 RepID=UPI00215CD181|nr:hypothetical protein [Arthrobacter sp. CJ23]UVJ40016.1 hypothetical protein NVV90_02140 [Arthrobacter sp. CJ23]
MALEQEQIEPILLTVRTWLSHENITGLTVGPKTVNGQETEQLAVVVHVVKKKDPEELGIDDLMVPPFVEVHVQDDAGGPPRVEQVATDVIETGQIRLSILDEKVRPTPGGYQVAVSSGFFGEATGTLGVNMVWGGRYRMLTNNHVISENGSRGPTVYQPDWALWGNSLSDVAGYVNVVTYANRSQPNPSYNSTDFAWCNIKASDGDPAIHGIGTPKGYRSPLLNEAVKWIGKQTATVQNATITGKSGQFVLEFLPGRWAWFENCISFSAGTVIDGDSGSAIVATSDMQVVGLIFASDSSNRGYGVRIPVP